jgi:hypothetical protein
MGARSAQKCSHLLQAAPLCPSWAAQTDVHGGHGFVNAFLGVKGSPVQIRPSRPEGPGQKGFRVLTRAPFRSSGAKRGHLTPVNVTQTKQSGVPSCISAEQRLLAIRAAGSVDRQAAASVAVWAIAVVLRRTHGHDAHLPIAAHGGPPDLPCGHSSATAIVIDRDISTVRCRPLGGSAESSLRLGAWPIEPWRRLGRDPYRGLRSRRVDPGSIWSD